VGVKRYLPVAIPAVGFLGKKRAWGIDKTLTLAAWSIAALVQ
jgi:hypothetical protein